MAGTNANVATWAFGGPPYGATNRVRGVPKWVAGTNANAATWAFGGAPYGATNRVRGVPKWVAGTNANVATWAFGGAPYKERRGEETRRGWEEEKRRGEKKREEERRGEEEGEEEKREEEETRGAVSSKRGPNTTGWLGITILGANMMSINLRKATGDTCHPRNRVRKNNCKNMILGG